MQSISRKKLMQRACSFAETFPVVEGKGFRLKDVDPGHIPHLDDDGQAPLRLDCNKGTASWSAQIPYARQVFDGKRYVVKERVSGS